MNPAYGKFSAAIVVAGVLVAGCASSPSVFATQGPEAARVAWLTWLMFGIAAVVLAVITALILLVFRRARTERKQADIYANDPSLLRRVLLGGGVVPIVVLMTVMGIGIAIENQSGGLPGSESLTIEVIGHQWWWEIHYTNQNFETATEIHIPVGQPVTVHVTTADVIHSFWVPQLHGKIDTIPGQTNTITLRADSPGVYRGQCAEFCGAQHANMAFLVIADPPATFQAWLLDQEKSSVQPGVGSIQQMGQQAFLGSACTYCHTIRGTNASGKIGPDLTHIASRTTIGSGILPMTRGSLAGWIINSQSIKPENHMPPMDLTSAQLQALLDYFASLK